MDYLDRIKQIKSEKKITNDVLSEKTGIPLGTLSILIIVILNSQSDNSKLSAISESGSDASFVHSDCAFCLFV